MKKMSEKEKESIADKKISRRSMLKWTAGLAVAGAVGIGVGYEASQLLVPPKEVVTTATQEAAPTGVPAIYWDDRAVVVGTDREARCPVVAHVRENRIAWVEPLQLTDEEEKSNWTITAGGQTFRAPGKSTVGPVAMSVRSRQFCPDRLTYPMKRVGWQPGGTSDVSNRGLGEFVRITWQEAFDTIANEIKRIKEKYGNSAILAQYAPHEEGGRLHHRPMWDNFTAAPELLGGYTARISFQDSAGYWSYSGPFTWGMRWNLGEGEKRDLLADTLKNSKLVVIWGTDPIEIGQSYGGKEEANWGLWMKQVGIRIVDINPKYTDTTLTWADQWIPIKPQTDAAMALAIANVWIKEGTYDKDYIATHTVGFDKFSDYVLGKAPGPDGSIDRTPDWASQITGVPAATITTLAREWGSKPTMMMAYESGMTRSAYGHEINRLKILLQAMQGLGKPGVNMCNGNLKSGEHPQQADVPGWEQMGSYKSAHSQKFGRNPVKQTIQRLLLPKAILTDFTKNPPLKWIGGNMASSWTKNEDFFNESQYPLPGYSEIHMVWKYGAGSGGGMMSPNVLDHARMYKNTTKIEFLLVETPRLEPETYYADMVLPANMVVERNDLGSANTSGAQLVYAGKAVESRGESMPDYEMTAQIADRLGVKIKFTDGNTEDDWLRKMYEQSSAAKTLSWEQFKAKGYYAVPFTGYKEEPGLRWYADKAEGSGLDTPSGKIEFYSGLIASKLGPDSMYCTPKYYVSPWGPWGEQAKTYPLAAVCGHSKFRCHSKWRNASFMKDIYQYKFHEPVWINPADANARGIKEKDEVRVFNNYGQLACWAHLTERMVPGAVWVPWGGWWTPKDRSDLTSIDLGSAFNVLVGMEQASPPLGLDTYEGGVMVQIEKWSGA
jgi:molybdopterin guanine dinucleotide-containing S/N-oxide reductase-like protein